MTTAGRAEAITRMSWWEIPVPDLDEAMRFYGGAFGWSFQPFGDDYHVVMAPDGTMIGGIFKVPAEQLGNGVSIVFETDDLEASLERVVAAGGTVVSPRAEIGGDMGWWATIADPAGTRIGLSTDKPPAP